MGKSCFRMMIWKGCCILMSKKGRMAKSILVLMSTMSFAVTGCQQNQRIQTDRDVLRVGVVTYTQDDPFINALTDKLKEDLKAMSTKDVKVIVSVKNGDNDQKNQDETIEEMIDAGCDVLCVNLVDRTAPATDYSVRTVLDAGISLEKLSYQFADWNRGQAENRMNRLISQYGEGIELILSNNDEMALGAVEAYRKAGYEPSQRPVIFGIDGLDDALEAIKDGEMQGTVYNDKEDQALQIAKLAFEVFKGEHQVRKELKEGRYYVSQYQQVDSSNAEEFLDR